jgi:hypothetical protein
VIVDLKPRELVLRPDMIVNMHALRLIQSADSDLNTVGKDCFVHAERASASGAEATLGKCRRMVASRCTTNPSEVFNAEVDKG